MMKAGAHTFTHDHEGILLDIEFWYDPPEPETGAPEYMQVHSGGDGYLSEEEVETLIWDKIKRR